MIESIQDFSRGVLGRTGIPVHRLGLSASYFPGRASVYHALDQGVNLFFGYGWDRQMIGTLKDVFPTKRNEITLVTGAYNFIWGRTSPRKSLERRLRQLKTDYIDMFLFLGVLKPDQLPDAVMEELCLLREEGKVRGIGLSTHDRKLAGRLASEGVMDALMIRYNAAHRGAEQDIFPHLAAHDPGVIGYTATRWGYLLRRPKNWPKESPIPSAGQCYRFVLSNPHVDVCLTAPRNLSQLKENLAAIQEGPLTDAEMAFMQSFGDVVHQRKKYFM